MWLKYRKYRAIEAIEGKCIFAFYQTLSSLRDMGTWLKFLQNSWNPSNRTIMINTCLRWTLSKGKMNIDKAVHSMNMFKTLHTDTFSKTLYNTQARFVRLVISGVINYMSLGLFQLRVLLGIITQELTINAPWICRYLSFLFPWISFVFWISI